MSHLEKDILKGKFGKNPQLKKEAREEEAEEKVEKKTGKHVKIREIAGKMIRKTAKRNPMHPFGPGSYPLEFGSKASKNLSKRHEEWSRDNQ